MNYMAPYEPSSNDQQGMLPALCRTGQRALAAVPGASWILKIVDHLYRQLSGIIAGYRYRRHTRSQFHKLMQGWLSSDASSRSAHHFCMRVYSLLTDSERRDQFVMAVVAFAQMDTAKAIAFFAQREQEYIDAYFNGFSITFQ